MKASSILQNSSPRMGHAETELEVFASQRKHYATFELRKVLGNRLRHGSSLSEINHASVLIFLNDGIRGVNHYCESPMLMIRDLHVRQLNYVCKVNEELMASDTRMRTIIATLLTEENNDLVKDLVKAASELCEVEYQCYVKNRRRADEDCELCKVGENGYVVKSRKYPDAPPRSFSCIGQRCLCDERIAEERMCHHEIKLHGGFMRQLFEERHLRRTRVGKSLCGWDDVNPRKINDILRCEETIDCSEPGTNDEDTNDEQVDCIGGSAMEEFRGMHKSEKKPDHMLGKVKPMDRQHLHNIVTTVSGKYTELSEQAKFKLGKLALDMQEVILGDQRKRMTNEDKSVSVLVPNSDMMSKQKKGQNHLWRQRENQKKEGST